MTDTQTNTQVYTYTQMHATSIPKGQNWPQVNIKGIHRTTAFLKCEQLCEKPNTDLFWKFRWVQSLFHAYNPKHPVLCFNLMAIYNDFKIVLIAILEIYTLKMII